MGHYDHRRIPVPGRLGNWDLVECLGAGSSGLYDVTCHTPSYKTLP